MVITGTTGGAHPLLLFCSATLTILPRLYSLNSRYSYLSGSSMINNQEVLESAFRKAIMCMARKGTAPVPTFVGYPWGLFSAKKKHPLFKNPHYRLTRMGLVRSILDVAMPSERCFVLAAIYPLQLANYLYSSISFIYCQGDCV